MRQYLVGAFLAVQTAASLVPVVAMAQERGTLAEKRVADLPPGPLFWRLENYNTLAEARAAEGALGLAAEAGGKVWLFTLGPAGGSSAGGLKVTEIGPLAPVTAPQYRLLINQAVGAPGSKRGVHTHPGTEAFYVLAGEQSINTPQGITRVGVGKSHSGVPAGTPMQSLSTGATDMLSVVMFVLDATQPFSAPAQLP